MSEYVTCEPEFTDATSIKEALIEIGVAENIIEVHDNPVPLAGYLGDSRGQVANIVIRRAHVGGSSNDIGFEKMPDGKYRAWVSDFDRMRGIGKQIVGGEFKQCYAKRTIVRGAGRIRGTIASCERVKDEKIRIMIRVP